jgi:hypothetical protein
MDPATNIRMGVSILFDGLRGTDDASITKAVGCYNGCDQFTREALVPEYVSTVMLIRGRISGGQ